MPNDSQPQAKEEQKATPDFSAAGVGSYLVTTHTGRTVRSYCVTKSDLSRLSGLNADTTVLTGVGSFFAASAIAFGIEWYNASASTGPGRSPYIWPTLICCVVSALSFVYAITQWIRRSSTIGDIEKESFDIPSTMSRD